MEARFPHFLAVILIGFFSHYSFGLTSTHKSCRILIHLEQVNGEHQEVQFSSAMKSKEACQTLAKLHQKSLDPRKTRSKRVTYVWKKVTKSVPILAKAPAKKSRKLRRGRLKNL